MNVSYGGCWTRVQYDYKIHEALDLYVSFPKIALR